MNKVFIPVYTGLLDMEPRQVFAPSFIPARAGQTFRLLV